jgi:hypothetical protein
MSLLEKLMDRVGETKVPRYAKESVGYRARIQETSEFKRIKNIPKQIIWDEISKKGQEENSRIMTVKYEQPQREMNLWNIQAAALCVIGQYQGALLPIGVGQGKALISLLAANEIDCERPLLVVPAQLREQTNKFVIPEMKNHWKIHPNLKVIGYSELSLEKNANMLEELQPDLLIFDEVHALKNKKAGRTRRVTRYLKAYPDTKVVAMSGTISNRSLKDWAHIAEWCLKERTPVPLNWNELMLWADAIDVKVKEEQRVSPGALMQFCKEGENVRQGFRRRFVETPGIVASKEDDLGVSLRLMKKEIDVPDKIKNMIREMKSKWETPNGDIITEAVDLWRHVRELSLGFWYTWEEKPPREWLDARREWKKYVRETLKHNRRGLDTELQVWNECQSITRNGMLEWIAWKHIKDTYKPKTVAVWESDFMLKACMEWQEENDDSIVWVEHREFGKQLEEYSGFEYFGAGDDCILCTRNRTIIASISAHGTGKNLQRFNKNLVVCPPSSGQKWEQMLARTHRHGQEADEVTCEMFMHIDELEKSFEQARADARYLEDTYGNRQKLNYADIVI